LLLPLLQATRTASTLPTTQMSPMTSNWQSKLLVAAMRCTGSHPQVRVWHQLSWHIWHACMCGDFPKTWCSVCCTCAAQLIVWNCNDAGVPPCTSFAVVHAMSSMRMCHMPLSFKALHTIHNICTCRSASSSHTTRSSFIHSFCTCVTRSALALLPQA
jgi:hypothetical protein